MRIKFHVYILFFINLHIDDLNINIKIYKIDNNFISLNYENIK